MECHSVSVNVPCKITSVTMWQQRYCLGNYRKSYCMINKMFINKCVSFVKIQMSQQDRHSLCMAGEAPEVGEEVRGPDHGRNVPAPVSISVTINGLLTNPS